MKILKKIPNLLLFTILQSVNTLIYGQNIGGAATYNFLNLPNSPLQTALGGTVVALLQADANLANSNPALLQAKDVNKLNTNIAVLYGGATMLNANYTTTNKPLQATINTGINYLTYGTTTATDAAGNILNTFTAKDYSIQVAIAKTYLQRWQYGITTKLIGSNYNQYNSYALAFDVGATYSDTANELQCGVVFKNMGFQLNKYATNKEQLPLNFQLGISKKLANAPLQFIFTATNLQQFDIAYNDTDFNNSIEVNSKISAVQKIFLHTIFGLQLLPTKNVTLTIAYNYLRQKELKLYNISNKLTGLSFGATLHNKKYTFNLAKAFYTNNKAYTQLGLGINFNELYK